ncbi:LacI family DNA-binding transcriptional regulator [Ruminococcus sp.]|uniref:LacI family DNA-binding transcriptional regulator n=1 Tax=Ruminococcus sp. TaxID=41978 RepID=UPI0025E49991|nr:LacI family DNA-binding transcriptional regulator [Ruminococcus sp.]MBQ8966698.1 LacI family DNA-binding transcriptional regulator [Ruminococcus sp.]
MEKNKKTQLEDIAAALGLSKSTVSRAISGKGRISTDTRERVLQCIKEMNYRPNMIAKSLSENKTYNIGTVIPMDSAETEAPFFQTCLMGISKECAVRDHDAVIIGTEKNDLSQLKRVVDNRKVDGIIITRPVADGGMEKMLRENGMPFVVIGQSVDKDVVTVDSDHTAGCRELTSYLLMSNPPESIGLILGSMEHTVNKSRLSGFEAAFAEAGSKPSVQLVYTDVESELQFSKAMTALMKQQPACIICGDDMLCMRLLAELSNLGLSVPDDIKVASFYDSVFLDSYLPPITSLIYNATELGATAVSQLMDMLEGEEVEKQKLMHFEMLVRRSTM